jgi:hypothetical protein
VTRRARRLSLLLLLSAVAAASCGPRAVPANRPGALAPTSPAVDAASAPRHERPKTQKVYPERRPPLGVTSPRPGEPSLAALAEARLVSQTCEKATVDDVDARLRQMRAEVGRSFQDWHDEQPQCWAQMREDYRFRKQEEALARGSMWGSAVGEAFGAGGLGLSGVGEGGGGVGSGIGLGSIGTIGHAGSAPVKAAKTRSETNNQVVGVDEADIVKTDGRYVYLVSTGGFRILEAMKPRLVSLTPIPGHVRELFVEGDRAVIFSALGLGMPRCLNGYDCQFAGDGTGTKVSVYDIANRAQPKLLRDFDLSGSLVAARRIGTTIHTVVTDNDTGTEWETWPQNLEMCGVPEATVRAKFAAMRAANERKIRAKTTPLPTLTEQGKKETLCTDLFRTPIKDGQAFTTVLSFDLLDTTTPPKHATVQSRPGAVFASANALYMSVAHRKMNSGRWYSFYTSDVNEVSEVHKFGIGASPKDTRYIGSGTVPGHVLNQFAMDEWYGYLRIATTQGKVPDPKVSSAVSILAEGKGGNLTRVGAVQNIAPGEDIRSVRFDGDRGYVVTFKKTDPLFVLDLFEPTRPAILGELKIPGFSTYMHRIDPEHLLSIGFDANDHGDFAYFDGVILQLFDVKNPTKPALLHKEKLGTRGSSSQATANHLAFNYLASEGLLAIPMTLCEGGGDGSHGNDLTFSGLLVYDVDIERGFKRLGGIAHHGSKDVSCQTWWTNPSTVVQRSLFLDDLVYSIASDRVKVQSMNHLGFDIADVPLTRDGSPVAAGL